MEGDINKVILRPTGKFETVENLFRYRKTCASPVRKELKKVAANGSVEEKEEMDRMRAELRDLISHPRIERLASRSIGEWDSEQKAVRLVRKEGKFQGFGYTIDGVQYLANFEALFLLDLNRLEIYYHSVLVSVEQAYHLLLGSEKSINYEKYLVYSTLSRAGYIVQKFQNRSYYSNKNPPENSEDIDCIWEVLKSRLDPNYEISSSIKSHDRFEAIQSSMASIVEKTKDTSKKVLESAAEEPSVVLLPAKRKATSSESADRNAKRRRMEYKIQHHSFVDCLDNSSNYTKFKNIFEKLDIVNLKTLDEGDDEFSCNHQIDFDLFLPNPNFKKTGNIPPNFRVIVQRSDDDLPNRTELVNIFQSQFFAVPLLVVSVSSYKHLQAFMFHFT